MNWEDSARVHRGNKFTGHSRPIGSLCHPQQLRWLTLSFPWENCIFKAPSLILQALTPVVVWRIFTPQQGLPGPEKGQSNVLWFC